ncbi:sensor histidine kinase [Actinoplanes sp. DH11]|uniref:sensor histidine kinase n=1 Tax=Actinoplanes sp. DH11 TaxID=2857011 RepID=UPI001E39A6AB|nr:histidine kinase [Actinoplanes sp. DH11]
MNRILIRAGQVAALGVLALLGIIDIGGGLGSSPFALALIATPMAVAAVWLPRHKPGSRTLPVAAIVVSTISLTITALLAMTHDYYGSLWGLAESAAFLVVAAVVARNARPAWAVGSLLFVGLAVAAMPLRAGGSAIYVTFGLVQALGVAGAIGAGVTLRNMENARRRALDTVRAEQRAEFARDLHDFIAHHVTGIVVQAQGARFIAEQDPKRVLLALEQIENAGAETMASMRRMVGVLRDPESRPDAPLAPVAGVGDLPALVEQFTAAGGLPARLDTGGDDGAGLPVEVSTSAYRVVMEALTNVRQHARQSSVVDVWLRRTDTQLLVRIANDGPPPRPAGPRDRPGYGLAGLTERVRAVGGQFSAGPGVDGGWVVDVALPLS